MVDGAPKFGGAAPVKPRGQRVRDITPIRTTKTVRHEAAAKRVGIVSKIRV